MEEICSILVCDIKFWQALCRVDKKKKISENGKMEVKKKILIIGAKGMLGRELGVVFSGKNLVLWDKEEMDISDKEQVFNKISGLKPKIVINAAAYNAVDEIEKDENFELAKKINGWAVGYLAKAAKMVGAITVHYSTGYVFDGKNSVGYKEDDAPNPISKYGESKYLGEKELLNNSDRFYLIRTNLLFGKPSISGTAKKSFVDAMLNLINKGQNKFNLVTDEVSNPTYAADLAQATFKLVDDNYSFGIYHLVNSGEASWHDFGKEIFKIMGLKKELNKISGEDYRRSAKRPKNSVLINVKFPALRTWREALKDYLSEKNL